MTASELGKMLVLWFPRQWLNLNTHVDGQKMDQIGHNGLSALYKLFSTARYSMALQMIHNELSNTVILSCSGCLRAVPSDEVTMILKTSASGSSEAGSVMFKQIWNVPISSGTV